MARTAGITVDASDVLPLLKGLEQVEKDLRDQANTRLRAAAGQTAGALIVELKSAAARSRTPQAVLVAQAMRVRRDRLVAVEVGGSQPVGHRGTAAGAILWGSERGGTNFVAAKGGHYWIQPAVESFQGSKAERAYIVAVGQILKDAGL